VYLIKELIPYSVIIALRFLQYFCSESKFPLLHARNKRTTSADYVGRCSGCVQQSHGSTTLAEL
jgi:hypothetical protein